MHSIKYKNVNGHYEIYVDGFFHSSCDTDELSTTLNDIEVELKNMCTNSEKHDIIKTY